MAEETSPPAAVDEEFVKPADPVVTPTDATGPTTETEVPESKASARPLEPQEELEAIFAALGHDRNHELLDKVWKTFETIKQQCIMEGPQKSWLACCVYTTVWLSTPLGMKPTLLFSVSTLIDFCELSIMEFFDRLEKWAAMINANQRLVDHIERIQGHLSVSIVVFDKFLPIFRQVFNEGQEAVLVDPDTGTHHELKTYDLYEYIWLSFIAFKKQLPKGSEDLLNCFHLLLVIVDLIVGDLLDRKINQFIKGDFLAILDAQDKTLLDYFCEEYNGVPLDAKHFRIHWFQQQAKAFVESDLLKMDIDSHNAYLDNIFYNTAYLSKIYEDAAIEKFEVDERIFIYRVPAEMLYDNTVDFGLVTGIRPLPDGTLCRNPELLSRKSSETSLHRVNKERYLKTPLSGRAYLANADLHYPIGLSIEESAQSRVHKLIDMVEATDIDAEDAFQELLKKLPTEVASLLDKRMEELTDNLISVVELEREADANFDASFTANILEHVSQVSYLFRRFLQKLTLAENARISNPASAVECLSNVFQRSEFVPSLWVCALEIVLYTFNSVREFPWSVNTAQLSPLSFYKIIEPVIRCDTDISRDMLKHLNRIEERVLEELAWSIESPMWRTIAPDNPIPSYEEVCLPDSRASDVNMTPRSISMAPPTTHTNIVSRYGGARTAKRRLEYSDETEASEPAAKKAVVDSKTHSAFYVFIRKVYYLAALHLTDLCDRVRMDERGRRRSWTLFEHILRNETRLMYGRHLDQNIMCCLYIIAKVSSTNIPFHEILYHYRHQPQATSRVYRNVLVEPQGTDRVVVTVDDGASRDSVSNHSHVSASGTAATTMRSGSTMPAPGMASAPPTPEPQNYEYHDLISYYNKVFVRRVEEFVKRMAFPDESGPVPLLTVPSVKCNTLSPRKNITATISVTPYGCLPPSSPARPLRYNVNRSPSKDLHHINQVIRQASMPHSNRVHQFTSSI